MSRINFGPKPWIFPAPAVVIATYNEDGSEDAMPAGWAGMCQTEPPTMMISLEKRRKTTGNILRNQAFTSAIPTEELVTVTDYFGITSANRYPLKFAGSGLHARRSEFVSAPVIEEFPVVMECKVIKTIELETEYVFFGEIVNVTAEEAVCTHGRVDQEKLHPIVWNPITGDYSKVGEKLGKAWRLGKGMAKKLFEMTSELHMD